MTIGRSLAILLLTIAPTSGDDPPPQSLRAKVAALVGPIGPGATVSVAYRDLASGDECLVLADAPTHPASTMKVPVMIEVFRRAAAGDFSIDDRLKLKDEFASLVDGEPFKLDPADDSERSLYGRLGQSESIRELVRLMITESSNLATNVLVERVSAASITATMKQLGAEGVVVLRGVEDGKAFAKGLNNSATARGMMVLMNGLAEGTVVSPAASAEMLAVLRAQKFNEGIPAGLPAGTSVAHKTGSIRAGYHDVALVEPAGRKPFVLVVLTRGIADEPVAHKLVADIARAAFESARGSK